MAARQAVVIEHDFVGSPINGLVSCLDFIVLASDAMVSITYQAFTEGFEFGEYLGFAKSLCVHHSNTRTGIIRHQRGC